VASGCAGWQLAPEVLAEHVARRADRSVLEKHTGSEVDAMPITVKAQFRRPCTDALMKAVVTFRNFAKVEAFLKSGRLLSCKEALCCMQVSCTVVRERAAMSNGDVAPHLLTSIYVGAEYAASTIQRSSLGYPSRRSVSKPVCFALENTVCP
jgi:hypothetical protein